MRKTIGFALAAILAAASPAFSGVILKLGGGMVLINGNDYNKAAVGTFDYLRDTSAGITGSIHKLDFSLAAGAEVIVTLGPRFGIGLGGGWNHWAKDDTLSWDLLIIEGQERLEPKLTVIPITLNAHFFLPLTESMTVDVFGGPGFYLGMFDFRASGSATLFDVSRDYRFQANKGAFGGQVGAALDIKLGGRISAFLEGSYRYARLSDIQGDYELREESVFGSESSSGSDHKMWYYELTLGGKTYPLFTFDSVRPEGLGVSAVREGRLDLSGFSATAGIKISF